MHRVRAIIAYSQSHLCLTKRRLLAQHRSFYLSASMRTTKRKAIVTQEAANAKRQKEQLPEYCDIQPRKDDGGAVLWPAAPEMIEKAQNFLKEWYDI